MTSEIKVDTISENTSANGVAIDGVKLKDNVVTVQGTSTTGGIIEIENTDTSGANGDFIGKINFKGNDSSGGASGTRAAIEAKVVSNFGSTELHFKTAGSGASATDAMIIDSAGHITKPLQPAFLVQPSGVQSDVANTNTIVFGTEVFDLNGDFSSNSFTAPVTGKYQINHGIRIDNLDSSGTWIAVRMNASNRTFDSLHSATILDQDDGYFFFSHSSLVDMDANDTVFLQFLKSGGSNTGDVSTSSYFSGYLVC